jgi:phospholipase C
MAMALKGINVLDLYGFNPGISPITKLPIKGFKFDVNSGNFKTAFTFIEPSYGNILGDYKNGRSQHPMADVAGGEGLIKQVYEAIRNSPVWYSSLLIITWDEHGGFYDHVKPGKAKPPGDKPRQKDVSSFGFPFDVAGVRVPAVIVSPWIARGVIDHRTYDHASLPATVLRTFIGRKASLTERDKSARDVLDLLKLRAPRLDAPKKLPNPPKTTQPVETADATPAPEALSDDEGNLWGYLYAVARCDQQMRPEASLTAIRDQVAGMRTRTEAAAYLEDVAMRLNATLAERDASEE